MEKNENFIFLQKLAIGKYINIHLTKNHIPTSYIDGRKLAHKKLGSVSKVACVEDSFGWISLASRYEFQGKVEFVAIFGF